MESSTNPHAAAPKAAASAVMDVVMPPPIDKADSPATEVDPLDQLAAEDHATQQATAKKAAKQPAPKPAKTKSPHAGVGLAITATVIIVLGLATLATYAYLQTVK